MCPWKRLVNVVQYSVPPPSPLPSVYFSLVGNVETAAIVVSTPTLLVLAARISPDCGEFASGRMATADYSDLCVILVYLECH